LTCLRYHKKQIEKEEKDLKKKPVRRKDRSSCCGSRQRLKLKILLYELK